MATIRWQNAGAWHPWIKMNFNLGSFLAKNHDVYSTPYQVLEVHNSAENWRQISESDRGKDEERLLPLGTKPSCTVMYFLLICLRTKPTQSLYARYTVQSHNSLSYSTQCCNHGNQLWTIIRHYVCDLASEWLTVFFSWKTFSLHTLTMPHSSDALSCLFLIQPNSVCPLWRGSWMSPSHYAPRFL